MNRNRRRRREERCLSVGELKFFFSLHERVKDLKKVRLAGRASFVSMWLDCLDYVGSAIKVLTPAAVLYK